MTFSKLTKMNLSNMFKRKEFFGISLISFLLFLLPTFLDLLKLNHADMSGIRPPWYYFGLSLSPGTTYDSPLVYQFIFLLIAPLLSCMAYSYCYFDEVKYRVSNIIVSKTGRRKYYLSSALVVFIGGFLVIFVPLILSLLAFLIAVPSNAYASIERMAAYQDQAFSTVLIFPSLVNNHPYIYNILYCFIPAIFCALIGLLSYSFSLYSKKNKFIIVSLPFILYVIYGFGTEIMGLTNWNLAHVIIPNFEMNGITLSHLIVPGVLLLLINACALIYKTKGSGDEL